MKVEIKSLYGIDYQLEMTITYDDGSTKVIGHIFEPEILSMYHCLAKECNSLLGTKFVYDENVIDNCAKAIEDKYSHYHYKWILHNNRDCTEFRPQSKYINLGFNSGDVYGFRWSKEQLIEFIGALGEYLDAHDIHKMAYEGEKAILLYHLNIGIGSTILNYYKDVCEADEDMKGIRVRYRKL